MQLYWNPKHGVSPAGGGHRGEKLDHITKLPRAIREFSPDAQHKQECNINLIIDKIIQTS